MEYGRSDDENEGEQHVQPDGTGATGDVTDERRRSGVGDVVRLLDGRRPGAAQRRR